MQSGSRRRLALALLLAGCGARPDPIPPVAAAGGDVCEGLAQVFYWIADDRDRGRSRASQVRRARRSVDHVFSDDPDETLRYLLHIVDAVYDHPEADAREIEASVRASCRVDEGGQAVLGPPWSAP